jgi:hypothetical protein
VDEVRGTKNPARLKESGGIVYTVKKIADEENTVPPMPPVVEPVVVEDAPATVPPHIRNTTIIVVQGEGAQRIASKIVRITAGRLLSRLNFMRNF